MKTSSKTLLYSLFCCVLSAVTGCITSEQPYVPPLEIWVPIEFPVPPEGYIYPLVQPIDEEQDGVLLAYQPNIGRSWTYDVTYITYSRLRGATGIRHEFIQTNTVSWSASDRPGWYWKTTFTRTHVNAPRSSSDRGSTNSTLYTSSGAYSNSCAMGVSGKTVTGYISGSDRFPTRRVRIGDSFDQQISYSWKPDEKHRWRYNRKLWIG